MYNISKQKAFSTFLCKKAIKKSQTVSFFAAVFSRIFHFKRNICAFHTDWNQRTLHRIEAEEYEIGAPAADTVRSAPSAVAKR